MRCNKNALDMIDSPFSVCLSLELENFFTVTLFTQKKRSTTVNPPSCLHFQATATPWCLNRSVKSIKPETLHAAQNQEEWNDLIFCLRY